MIPDLSEVTHFGKYDKSLPSWRNKEIPGEDLDNDEDEALPYDVMGVLGFDPDEE